jgi:hypothetical protein
MHTRMVTFTGAKNIDGGIAYVRDQVLPVLNAQKGFRGTTVSTDRANGVLGILSLWETEADRDASDSALAKARQEGLDIVGGNLTVETFEELVAEISEVPSPGSALMVTRVSMDPAKIDENFAYFKSEVLPRIKAQAGFQALRNMINRKSGKGATGVVWANADAMKAAAGEAESRRAEGIARGVSFDEVSFRELALVELR